MSDRSVYVQGVSPQQAVNTLLELIPDAIQIESVSVRESIGRITAGPVFARRSVPHYPAAAMDGIAVQAESTAHASEVAPVRLNMGIDAVVVDTGDPVPDRFDAVIMSEVVQKIDDQTVTVDAAAAPWQHVRPIGEDMVAGDMIVPRRWRIRPVDAAAMLAGGNLHVDVRRKPIVVIVPTGDEVVAAEHLGSDPEPGMVVETNSIAIAGMVREMGGEPTVCEITADDMDALITAVKKAAADGDIVVINAGSSAGRGDFVPDVIAQCGRLLGRGLTIRPGKPASFGWVDGTPIIGLPGYPVSTLTVFELLVGPLLEYLLDYKLSNKQVIRASVTRHIPSLMGVGEYVRMRVGVVDNRIVSTPLGRGAGATMSMVRADGVLIIPEDSEGVVAGAEVDIELKKPFSDIMQTTLVSGSHDLSLDLIDDIMRSRGDGRMQAASVGSLGGIIALVRGEAHFAGCHLFDSQTGDFNVPYIRKHAGNERVLLITVADRTQGLMTAADNPLGITGIGDLCKQGVRFVNRQRGSGTRMLLDHLLGKAGIDPSAVAGYEREEFTHSATAAAVKGGSADCGLGIYAVAKAMNLGFVPLSAERFELAVLERCSESELVNRVADVIDSPEFKAALSELGGYDTTRTGKRRWVEKG